MSLNKAYGVPGGGVTFGEYIGVFDASSGSFPSTNNQADWYNVTIAGIVDGVVFALGDILIALVDNPSITTFAGNWSKVTNITVDDHLNLSNIGTNGHPAIDTHIADGSIHFPQLATVGQAEAEEGTATIDRIWTAQRVKQAIAALESGGGVSPSVEFEAIDLASVSTSSTVLVDVTGWVAPAFTPTAGEKVRINVVGLVTNTVGSAVLNTINAAHDNTGSFVNLLGASGLRSENFAVAGDTPSSFTMDFTLPAAVPTVIKVQFKTVSGTMRMGRVLFQVIRYLP